MKDIVDKKLDELDDESILNQIFRLLIKIAEEVEG